ncbi:MAG: DUF4190 domain-containing protein [Ilumatobacter sp.]|uniref:DUF4190 domain-containing protein n=1 Tax=Ilumatobacter sp. TaxID=1967498 RepID=UPI0032981A52
MSDDQNPWFSDGNSGAAPPPAYGSQPTYPPTSHPQQAPQGYQPYGQAGFGPVAQSNGKATASMIVGIVGLAMLPCYGVPTLFMAPIAFFLGRSSQKEIDAAPGAWSNRGMAKAGWILGLIGIILVVLFAIAVAALFIWAASADDSNF